MGSRRKLFLRRGIIHIKRFIGTDAFYLHGAAFREPFVVWLVGRDLHKAARAIGLNVQGGIESTTHDHIRRSFEDGDIQVAVMNMRKASVACGEGGAFNKKSGFDAVTGEVNISAAAG